MDAPFFHPKLVHLPIALGLLMPLITTGLLLAWWRNWLSRRAWAMAVGLQAILVGSGIAAMRSGEAEEDRVEKVVAERFIEAHEEAAEAFTWASGGVLGLMLLAGVLATKRPGLPIAAVATAGTVAVLVLGIRTGQAGGSLVYEHGAAQVYTTPPATNGAQPGPEVKRSHEDEEHERGDD